jgi:hypothetical protein
VHSVDEVAAVSGPGLDFAIPFPKPLDGVLPYGVEQTVPGRIGRPFGHEQ